MNFLDRAIAYVAPRAGRQRIMERAATQAAVALTTEAPFGGLTAPSGYDAGRRGGIKGMQRRPRSANVDYIGGQRTQIGASRFAWMNTPLGRAAIERPVEFTIGSGLMAIPDV